MPDRKRSAYTTVTTAAATNFIVITDTARADGDQNVIIDYDDFFGDTTGIPVDITIMKVGSSAVISASRSGGASVLVQAGVTTGQVGTTSTHELRLIVDSANKFSIATTGIITSADTYGHNVNGETIRAMQVNDSGEFGVDLSTMGIKENVQDLSDYENIYKLRPVTYDSKKPGGTKGRHGLIAEEVEPLFPGAVFYDTFQVVEDQLIPIDRDDYTNHKEIRNIEKNKKVNIIAKKIVSRDADFEPLEIEDIEIEVKRVVQGINPIDLMPSHIKATLEQKKVIDRLIERVTELEGIEK